MRVNIQSPSFELTPALETRIRQGVASGTRRFADSVVSIDVFLKDVNGPKGGHDKLVRFRASLRDRQAIVVETVRNDLYAAIDVTARRLRRSIRRSVQKRRRLSRARIRSFRQYAAGT